MSERYDVELSFNVREDIPEEVLAKMQRRIESLKDGYSSTKPNH